MHGGAYDEGDVYVYAAVDFDLGNDWALGATAGYTEFDNDGSNGNGDLNYAHAQADLTKSAGDYGDVTLTVSVAEEDAESIADALKERMSEAAGGCFFVPLTSNLSWRVIVRVYIFFPSRYPCAPPYPPALVSVEFKQICAT